VKSVLQRLHTRRLLPRARASIDRLPVTAPPPDRRTRLAIAAAFGLVAAGYVLARAHAYVAWGADIDQSWAGALALRAGADPYVAVGPTGTFLRWPWPLFYPLPALLLALPLTAFPMVAARAVFLGMSSAWLAYGLTRQGYWSLALFGSAAYLGALAIGAWEPLLVAAALTPGGVPVYLAKPNVGLALASALPFRRATLVGLAVACALVAISVAVRPTWIGEWLNALRGGTHLAGPITRVGGILVLAALTKWRRAEARLLVAMASVPQTMFLQAALPLFLVARSRAEILLLALLSYVPYAIQLHAAAQNIAFQESTRRTGDAIALCLYLPCVVLVLRRPNVWTTLGERP